MAAAFADSFTKDVPADLEIHNTELLLSGTLSPMARAKIEGRGVRVVEQAFDQLKPPPDEISGEEE